MPTGTSNFFDSFKLKHGNGGILLSSDSYGVLLTTSTYTPSASTHVFVDDVTNELSVVNGYDRLALTNTAFAVSGGDDGQTMLDSDDPVWTASGGSIVARYWVLYDNTPTTDATRELIAYGLLDNTPANMTATDGNTLKITVPATGWFTQG